MGRLVSCMLAWVPFVLALLFANTPPHIVQIGVEGTVSLVMPSPTPVTSGHIEEVPVLEEHVHVPLVHTEAMGSAGNVEVVEHSPTIQEGLDVNSINDPANV